MKFLFFITTFALYINSHSILLESAGQSWYKLISKTAKNVHPNYSTFFEKASTLLDGSFKLNQLLILKDEATKAVEFKPSNKSLKLRLSKMKGDTDPLKLTRKLALFITEFISTKRHSYSIEECSLIKTSLSKLFKVFGFTRGIQSVFGIQSLDAYQPGPLRMQKLKEMKVAINEIRNELQSKPSIFISPLFKSLVMILYWLKFYEDLLDNKVTAFPEIKLIEMRKDFIDVIISVAQFTKVVPEYYVTKFMYPKEIESFFNSYKSIEESRTANGWRFVNVRDNLVNVKKEVSHMLDDYKRNYLNLIKDASVAGSKYEKLIQVKLIRLDSLIQMCKESNDINEIDVLLKAFPRIISDNIVFSDYFNLTGLKSIPRQTVDVGAD